MAYHRKAPAPFYVYPTPHHRPRTRSALSLTLAATLSEVGRLCFEAITEANPLGPSTYSVNQTTATLWGSMVSADPEAFAAHLKAKKAARGWEPEKWAAMPPEAAALSPLACAKIEAANLEGVKVEGQQVVITLPPLTCRVGSGIFAALLGCREALGLPCPRFIVPEP